MNAKDIVEILREYLQSSAPDQLGSKFADAVWDATFLIESQTSEIAELEQQLAASQREKQAAVEDMEKCMHYASPKNNNLCNFCLKDMAEYPQKCGGWEDAAKCCPKWRGPQEAGEGDSNA